MANTQSASLLMALMVICLFSCKTKEEEKPQPKVIPVKAIEISLSNSIEGSNFIGTVEESFAVSLSFPVMGTVEQIYATEGKRVKKGQLLATLSTATLQNSYDAAASTLKQAEDAHRRLSQLHAKGSLPDIKMVEIETNLQQAKSMEAITRKNLEDSKLRAPFAGVIAAKKIDEGMNVAPGISAFKLVSINEVDVNVSIPENEIGSISVGQEATVNVPALDNKVFKGKIEQRGVMANPLSHTYEVKVRLSNPQAELMPGMVCKVNISNDAARQTVVLPAKAVQIAFDGKRFVWLVEGDRAKRQFITVGSLTDHGVTIEEGLSQGQKVITEGYHKVSEGMLVSIR